MISLILAAQLTFYVELGTGQWVDYAMRENSINTAHHWHGVVGAGVSYQWTSTVTGQLGCDHRSSLETNDDDGPNFCAATMRLEFR